jgi:ATP-dependent DNA helicase PIF1
MKEVIGPKFGVTDHFNRYEWQGRGSTHSHGLNWVPESPDGSHINDDNDEGRQARADFAAFWGQHVVAYNPNPSLPPSELPPIALPSGLQENTETYLTSILNRVQIHQCSEAYCLRTVKGSSEKKCRFYFPHALRDEAVLTKEFNPNYWMFAPMRNQERINSYNRLITIGWLANIDVTPCTTTQAVINYVAKYATKAEKKTNSYADILHELLPRVAINRPLLSLVSKLMNKLVGERDWSAQEVCHLLLNLPLTNGSRQVINVDCRPTDKQSTYITIEDGEVAPSDKSNLEKYATRPQEYEGLTYLTNLMDRDLRTFKKRRATTVSRVLNYWPRYKPDRNGLDYEDFCRVKVMMHHPFCSIDDLLTSEAIDVESSQPRRFESWAQAYEICSLAHVEPPHPPDGLILPQEPVDDDEFEDAELEADEELTDWQDLARQRPNDNRDQIEDSDHLGNRISIARRTGVPILPILTQIGGVIKRKLTLLIL